MQMEWKSRIRHSSRPIVILSVSEESHALASLRLRMTMVADSSYFARCADSAICWYQ